MDCWRQWIRHRMANVNEYSTRYSVAIDSAQTTETTEWRAQSDANRQGSGTFLDASTGAVLSQDERNLHELTRQVYERRLAAGVAREQARKDLTLSTYTEAYWKIDLHNLLHFLSLRMDPHAQHEIRQYATIIGENIVKRWCPVVWEAFADFRLASLSLSRIDVEIVGLLTAGRMEDAIAVARQAGMIGEAGVPLGRNREREELEVKLAQLHLRAPWTVTLQA